MKLKQEGRSQRTDSQIVPEWRPPWSRHCFGTQFSQQRAFLVVQKLKHLPPMRETQVQSLGREDPPEKEMVTHSSILAWRIPWTEKPDRLQSMGSQESDTTERLHLHLTTDVLEFS